jgi:hypothetical protein
LQTGVGGHSGFFHRGKSGAFFGALLVLLGLVSIISVVSAPGEITISGGDATLFGSTPQVQIVLSLKNGGLVDVRTDPVIQATFVLGNGSTVREAFYCDSLTVPAGGMTRIRWTVSLPADPLKDVILTAFLRVRGPISAVYQEFQLP